MNDVWRQELGFEGVVESEGGGFQTLIHAHIVSTQNEAGALALIDRAVRRVLRLKFRLGLFENPYVDVDRAARVVHSQEHQDLVLRAGREGIVLLKNEKNLLPLTKNLKSVAVIGPNAENRLNQLGDYPPSVIPRHIVSIQEGIKAKVEPGAKVTAVKGCKVSGEDKSRFAEAIRAAKNSANPSVLSLKTG